MQNTSKIKKQPPKQDVSIKKKNTFKTMMSKTVHKPIRFPNN